MIRETASTEKKKFKTLEYPDPKSITKDMTETSIRLKRIKDITGVSCFGLREVG